MTNAQNSGAVERLAYGYELMHRAICQMAGTSGADGRWYYERANEVFKRVVPVFAVTPESNTHKPGDCLTEYKRFSTPAPSDQAGFIDQIARMSLSSECDAEHYVDDSERTLDWMIGRARQLKATAPTLTAGEGGGDA